MALFPLHRRERVGRKTFTRSPSPASARTSSWTPRFPGTARIPDPFPRLSRALAASVQAMSEAATSIMPRMRAHVLVLRAILRGLAELGKQLQSRGGAVRSYLAAVEDDGKSMNYVPTFPFLRDTTVAGDQNFVQLVLVAPARDPSRSQLLERGSKLVFELAFCMISRLPPTTFALTT
jgi:hypothetical protein